jgi:two-component system NtrC family sensor kinase
MGDPGQLQQVLLNLFNNAFDAITARHGNAGGALSIDTFENAAGQAEIVIADNGCGVKPENIEKIFTPFFTTKPVGKGTGLGLPVCYGIVCKMGGDISVESTPGKGTTFLIRLPAEARPRVARD